MGNVMGRKTQADERTDEMKREMAEHFAEFEEEYRTEDWAQIVYEDEETVVVADTKGYEFSEWANEFEDFDGFSQTMHDLARQVCNHNWGTHYPVVFDKMEDSA